MLDLHTGILKSVLYECLTDLIQIPTGCKHLMKISASLTVHTCECEYLHSSIVLYTYIELDNLCMFICAEQQYFELEKQHIDTSSQLEAERHGKEDLSNRLAELGLYKISFS